MSVNGHKAHISASRCDLVYRTTDPRYQAYVFIGVSFAIAGDAIKAGYREKWIWKTVKYTTIIVHSQPEWSYGNCMSKKTNKTYLFELLIYAWPGLVSSRLRIDIRLGYVSGNLCTFFLKHLQARSYCFLYFCFDYSKLNLDLGAMSPKLSMTVQYHSVKDADCSHQQNALLPYWNPWHVLVPDYRKRMLLST